MAQFSAELKRYFWQEDRSPQVTLAEMLDLAGERVFGFLFVLLALPSALPIPAPGYSIPFGVVMFGLAMQLVIGAEKPWVPQRVLDAKMPLEKVQGIVNAGIPWLQKIEAIAKPRLSYLCTSLPGRIILGLAIALMSTSMMIPVPGTNTLPAIAIFVIGFGLSEDDGFISLAGLGISVVAASVSIGLIFFGVSILNWVKDFILG
ncbi:exopolysaccharide biosynthesis protein [Roseofilum casamattae]|uniref:Exopolysaccharide biosynthesis protein n=1 Tax=Roseofilum casamattae BLCC-M143 TaxID=3022442 RepID=A0ABT7BTE6_9CYAN|nr:exopolysaccharide biosynthesis protein [Roseofilum casamattae]MDJ1182458.1 exopolysaccharide biosynthesis protein [Roseofilum casamattae BLCC-M143]